MKNYYGHGVQLVDDELENILGRGALHRVGLLVGERRRHQRDVAVSPDQLEIEERAEEAQFVREQFELLHHGRVVGVVLIIRQVDLVDALQVHVHLGDGAVGPFPGGRERIRRRPASIVILVDRREGKGELGMAKWIAGDFYTAWNRGPIFLHRNDAVDEGAYEFVKFFLNRENAAKWAIANSAAFSRLRKNLTNS